MFKNLKEEIEIFTEEELEFVRCFAKTLSVKDACRAAGFCEKTAFARASRLLERGDAREEILNLIAERHGGRREGFSREEERILREYERIAFADTSDGEIKVSDKLRALDQYRLLLDRMRGEGDGDLSLVVNYDYGQ